MLTTTIDRQKQMTRSDGKKIKVQE